VFIGGAYMSWLLWRSGSIWLPIICHAATNCFFLVILALYSFR
jgi:membrane protease YdiL (CAAX protease family)